MEPSFSACPNERSAIFIQRLYRIIVSFYYLFVHTASPNFYKIYSFNDILAISQDGVQFRTDDSVNAGGLFFS